MVKTAAMLFAIVFLVVGVLGFVPGATTDGMLFGVFHVNAVHNIIHLVSGLLALWAYFQGAKACRMYFQVFGVIYALVAVLGFVYGDSDIVSLVSSNMADTWLHVVIAVVSLYLGFATQAEAAEPAM